ncbi:unnamed protein product [Trifolium pratense]|uniref:Uncharacterized protein n=1 Tax=Trifolium pratense TaxID=57577 RepID=A0ACB0JKP9_TRIPR|nr:unnamed protein product [Trifolium pratense]
MRTNRSKEMKMRKRKKMNKKEASKSKGEEDNVISQIHRPVKELAFPGSAQLVDRLLKNQKQSYFVNTQPQQREEERPRKRDPVSSILGTF